jgi:pimeloyl-ACP methyl ester carboxylesterase
MSTRTIETTDGRTLQIHEAGDPEGELVLMHHGTPTDGSLYAPWVEDATQRGIRLVGYDRPGYGGSSRHSGRRVSDAARDAETIAAALGADRFATWGISGGGPHTLACATLLPGKVVAAVSLASPAPYGAEGLDWLGGMGEGNVVEFGAALEGEDALRPRLEQETAAMLAASPEQIKDEMATVLSPLDYETLTGRLARHIHDSTQGALGGGVDGWLDDDLAFAADWGFDPRDAAVPTLIWQGEHDLMVPPAHARWLGARVPQAEFRFSADEGHITLYERGIPAVHEWLLRFF